MPEPSAELFWIRRAARLRAGVNAARWFESLAPAIFAILLTGVAGVLATRGMGKSVMYPLVGCAVASGLAAGWHWHRARRGFETTRDAYARLDLQHGLHNRLSSAAEGVGAWPLPVTTPGFRWQRSRGVNLLMSGGVLLFAALFAPIGGLRGVTEAKRPEPPAALREMRAAAKRLEAEKAVEPKALAELEKRAEALLRQPESSWYDAATLEAAEHLRDRLKESLRDLDKDLSAIGAATDRLAESGDFHPDSLSPELARALGDALEGLDLSALPPPAALREALSKLKPGALHPLDAKRLDELRRAVADAKRRLRRAGAGDAKQGGTCNAAADGLPIFIFAPGPATGPDSLLKLALGAADSAKVDSELKEADAQEREKISEILSKAKPRVHLQTGCKAGMSVVGLVVMPDASAPDPEPVTDALEDLVYGEVFAVSESEPSRRALSAALSSGRLRLVPFELKSCDGKCRNGSCNKPGGALVLVVGTGSGGPGGGGGPAPLSLGDKTSAKTGQTESLSNKDLSHAKLGDLQGLSSAKHKVDQDAWKGAVSGGALSSEGDGSEAVWTDNLTPEERETLKRYFRQP